MALVWQPRDLPIGVGLLLLGYAVVVGIALVLREFGHPEVDTSIALAVALVTLGFEVWLGAIVLILATRRDLSLADLGFRMPGARQVKWIFATVAGAYGIIIAYGIAVVLVQEATGTDLSRLIEGNALPESDASTALVWAVLGLSVVLAAPFGEELFFRALMFRSFAARWGLPVGLAASGLLFALVHFEVSVVLPFWGVGAWFAWAYHRSGSLWTTVSAHAIFNGISFAVTVAGVQP
ncbi:MAG: type II CAAX endopeptidase family protein [Dehalococcoidia bacterium]